MSKLAPILVIVMMFAARTATADSGLTVLGPVGNSRIDVAAVKAAVTNAGIGPIANKPLDAACATDPGCLINIGTQIGASRALAIIVGNGGRLTLMLVDVGGGTLVGTRDVVFAKKKLAKELGPALKKIIDELTTDKAKALFAEGNQHYNVGEFDKALERYKLAYRVKPLPAFQFNIGQCHRKLGQYQEAIAMYQAYLVDVPKAADKKTVDSLIEEAKKALADQKALERQRLATEQKTAEEARKAKEAEAEAAAEQSKVARARIAAEHEREQSYNRHPARKWMLITGGLGLAAAGVGGYFGLQALDARAKFDESCQRGMLLLPDEIATCQGHIDRGNRDARLANILIGSGGAVLLASAIVYILDPGNIERPTRTVAVTPSSVQLIVRW